METKIQPAKSILSRVSHSSLYLGTCIIKSLIAKYITARNLLECETRARHHGLGEKKCQQQGDNSVASLINSAARSPLAAAPKVRTINARL